MKYTSSLELYIKNYIAGRGRSQIKLNFVRKALALINEKLGIPCCETPDATINFYTRFDNDLTNTVRGMLRSMPRKGHVQSLTRAATLLTNTITPLCCD